MPLPAGEEQQDFPRPRQLTPPSLSQSFTSQKPLQETLACLDLMGVWCRLDLPSIWACGHSVPSLA